MSYTSQFKPLRGSPGESWLSAQGLSVDIAAASGIGWLDYCQELKGCIAVPLFTGSESTGLIVVRIADGKLRSLGKGKWQAMPRVVGDTENLQPAPIKVDKVSEALRIASEGTAAWVEVI